MDDQPPPAQDDENRFPVTSFSLSRSSRPPIMAVVWVVGIFLVISVIFWGSVMSGIGDDFKPGYTHYQQGNYAAAETDFRKFTQGSWTDNEGYGHYYLGLCLLQEGKIDEAQSEIQFARDHSGGGRSGPDAFYYHSVRLLEVIKDLPPDPTTAQREQWIAKHPKLFHPK